MTVSQLEWDAVYTLRVYALERGTVDGALRALEDIGCVGMRKNGGPTAQFAGVHTDVIFRPIAPGSARVDRPSSLVGYLPSFLRSSSPAPLNVQVLQEAITRRLGVGGVQIYAREAPPGTPCLHGALNTTGAVHRAVVGTVKDLQEGAAELARNGGIGLGIGLGVAALAAWFILGERSGS